MNWLKDKFATQATVNGIWLSAGSHVAAELAAAAGFDWALLDLEHGLGDKADVLRMIQVLSRTGCAPIVRVPTSTSETIKWALDFGASGVMAPMVESAEQAAAFIRTLRYPPAGSRGLTSSSRAAGYGYDFRDYFRDANAKITGIVQIETAQGVAQADAIAATAGVDVLFIGHSDLSLALGCFENLTAPVMQAAEATVLAACVRHGRKAGMLFRVGMTAELYRQKGFSVLALGSDVGCLKQGYNQLLAAAKNNK